MSIWYYNKNHQQINTADIAYKMDCMFCGTTLIRNNEDEQKVEMFETMNYGMSDKFTTTCRVVIGICAVCGWWKYGVGTSVGGTTTSSFETRIGSLKKLDLLDVTIPISEVRSYLSARYESRFEVNPRVFEEGVERGTLINIINI